MLNINIKYFDESLEPVAAIDKGDWIDLRAATDAHLVAGQFALIPLGVAMEIPEMYEAHLAPRSSAFKNWGIIQTNSVGVIDNSYCGDKDEWKMPVYATRDTQIKKGDRICQFRIIEKQPMVKFTKVASLGDKNRGGFGSTGIK